MILRKLPFLFLLSALMFWPAFGQTQHGVTLTWTASTTSGVTYNVYRGTVSGGPYTKLNTAPVNGLTYFDGSGVSGTQYFYVATAVNSSGVESVVSNEASATFLVLPGPPGALKAVAN